MDGLLRRFAPRNDGWKDFRRMGGAERCPSPCASALMGIAALHPSCDMPSRSRDADRPRFASSFAPRNLRAQGRPGAHCTRGLACKCALRERAHEHTGSAEAVRPSLRNGFTAYNVISPENGSFASVAAQRLLRNLAPAPRRQDHTTSPYASATLVRHGISVHRISPRVRDDGRRPSSAVRRAGLCR